MAYEVKQDRLRAILPDGYEFIRTVLRINTEICKEKEKWIRIELNMPMTPFLESNYTSLGVRESYPAEKDNDGCDETTMFVYAEKINIKKEFCDCQFQ